MLGDAYLNIYHKFWPGFWTSRHRSAPIVRFRGPLSSQELFRTTLVPSEIIASINSFTNREAMRGYNSLTDFQYVQNRNAYRR